LNAGRYDGAVVFGIGLCVGLVCMLSAIRQGKVCANGIVGVSQGHNVMVNTLIYAALPEFYVFSDRILRLSESKEKVFSLPNVSKMPKGNVTKERQRRRIFANLCAS
ncbi:MAG: hypothetical protein IKP99_00960, partial [Bacteroidales bacterium]|nr:hypothetical protein [Bacteroidales bacterium]